MIIRKAKTNDSLSISEIYERIHDEEACGKLTTGWIRNVYPTISTVEDALDRDDLFVADDDGDIVGAAIINHVQCDAYKDGNWECNCNDEEILVMHTLVVDPRFFKSGIGMSFVCFYEEYARITGCKSLRLDTQEKNIKARSLYKKCGFTEVGIVPCVFNGIPNVKLVLLEKPLFESVN